MNGNTDKKQRLLQDLHLHSEYSDGQVSIARVAEIAHSRGLHAIAFTDHTDIEGNFLYCTRKTLDFSYYLSDITNVRKRHPDMKVWCGIEVSEDFNSVPDAAESVLRACDFVLVDGYYLTKPVEAAQKIRDWCELFRESSKPVGVSHPRFEAFNTSEWDIIIRSKIFLEINNSKINKAQIAGIKRLLEYLGPRTLHWSIGSDAHTAGIIGDLAVAWRVIEELHLQDHVLTP